MVKDKAERALLETRGGHHTSFPVTVSVDASPLQWRPDLSLLGNLKEQCQGGASLMHMPWSLHL